MRAMRFSLFTKIIFWVFLNLLLLGAILFFIFNLDFRFSPRSPFFSESANRINTASRLISTELSKSTRAERDAVLAKYSEAYNVEFFAFDSEGRQIAGREEQFSAEVTAELKRLRESLPPPESLVTRRSENADGKKNSPPAGRPEFFLKTDDPPLYWSVTPMMISEVDQPFPQSAILLTASTSVSNYGLLYDSKPWLIIAGAITLFSILFWLPMVRGITKAVGRVTEATEKIAEEDFDVRVNVKRSDEIGRLGKAVNQLASRLSGFVHGQKRFLGDISHELNSPLARLQLALSVMEDYSNEKTQSYLESAQEEVKLMSKLVGELLDYSKAGIKTTEVKLEAVNLRSLAARLVKREQPRNNGEIEIKIDEHLTVRASPDLLARALDNVVRNAIRYAGDAGKITIAAENKDDQIALTVADLGAGVPESEVEKLFDPFYRVQTHRSRESGGTGLGLAIVKTCVEACGGRVFAKNRIPNGLEVTILMQKS